ncbi:hypothetical protein roselon_02556 [Roseibacterium elongatum DSM 19469]|uniref:DUF177 domain-containing protein n=1 Tax=Roseicyclus elongatus DSM 19469 TaxID=1294273 RepID=W8RUI6_9RHOB|nr:DUF177 domain-containing protein [Roseibacterium elongatum]AHM04874.1 hypothetical protein roselon_02556 [Roseibacterium elongatum DSM 19469]
MPTDPPPPSPVPPLVPGRLSRAAPHQISLQPTAEARAELARALSIDAIRKLRFEGALIPEGKHDWRLDGTLGATVVQPCVVTLVPVTTRIDAPVTRRFLHDMSPPVLDDKGEAEMPEDDSAEPLPDRIDPYQIMVEALALNLPDYPRAEGADLGTAVFSEPGIAPMTDQEAKPLAGLKALRDKLAKGSDDPN